MSKHSNSGLNSGSSQRVPLHVDDKQIMRPKYGQNETDPDYNLVVGNWVDKKKTSESTSLPLSHSEAHASKQQKEKISTPTSSTKQNGKLPAGFSDSDSDGGFNLSGLPTPKKSAVENKSNYKVSSSVTSYPTSTVSKNIRMASSKNRKTVKTKRASLPPIPYINLEQAKNVASELNAVWQATGIQGRVALVSQTLRSAFKDSVNAYSMGLYLCLHSQDFFLFKNPSLAFTVLTELKKWLVDHNLDGDLERQFLSPPLQMVAFQIMTSQKNLTLLRFIVTIYRLDLIRNQLVVPIKKLTAAGNYKDACVYATILRLYTGFTIEDFLIPLILQDRANLAEEFMIGSEEVQKSVLSYLDELLVKDNMSAYLRSYTTDRNITCVNKNKFEVRAMSKLIQRLREKFKIDPKTCPNSSRRSRAGSLRHVLSRKYGETTDINDECFEDMIDELVGDDVMLQEETLFLLRIYGDFVAAAKFALRKTMNFSTIPADIQAEMRKINSNVCPEVHEVAMEDEDLDAQLSSPTLAKKQIASRSKSPPKKDVESSSTKDESSNRVQKRSRPSQNFYSLPIPTSQIRIVESIEGVELFLKHLRNGQMNLEKSAKKELFTVGFDAEWKPINPSIEGVALIQVATPEYIFLIDTLKLKGAEESPQTSMFKSLFKEFFANEKIIKLSYGGAEDSKQLAATTSIWKQIKTQFKSVIDLQTIAKDIQKICPKFFPHYTDQPSQFKGLAELVRLCTGTPLNKDEQWSNWEKRPLRDTQLIYASADTYCLLEVYDFMKIRCREKSVDFRKLIDKQLRNSGNGKKGGRKRSTVELVKNVTTSLARSRNNSNNSPFKTIQPASKVKIIVDSMFADLGRKLRACGIDTLILDEKDSHTKCATYAVRDDRYIVTQPLLFEQLSSYVSAGHCYQITSNTLMTQLHDVLIHFNISVNDTDIFTRCQRCNCKVFINVPSSNMKNIVLHSMPRSCDNSTCGNEIVGAQQSTIYEDMIPASLSSEKKSLKSWELLSVDHLRHPDSVTLKTKSGVNVEFQKIPISLLDSIDDFYICNDCGRSYWQGIHLERVLAASQSNAEGHLSSASLN